MGNLVYEWQKSVKVMIEYAEYPTVERQGLRCGLRSQRRCAHWLATHSERSKYYNDTGTIVGSKFYCSHPPSITFINENNILPISFQDYSPKQNKCAHSYLYGLCNHDFHYAFINCWIATFLVFSHFSIPIPFNLENNSIYKFIISNTAKRTQATFAHIQANPQNTIPAFSLLKISNTAK